MLDFFSKSDDFEHYGCWWNSAGLLWESDDFENYGFLWNSVGFWWESDDFENDGLLVEICWILVEII